MPAESHHVSPTEDCPRPDLWGARDAAASEDEVGDFLYGLVRVLKPGVVVETGCYLGDTTLKINKALAENEYGVLYACDIQEKYVNFVRERLGQALRVIVTRQEGISLVKSLPVVHLAFIDSGGDRLEEAKALNLSRHGILVLHDSRHESVKDFGKQLGMVEVFIPTPRGISIFKKA